MKIEVNVSAKVIANMMTSAIESGDPVTTAARGGWCNGIFWNTKAAKAPRGAWYAKEGIFSGHFQLEVHEVADEGTFDPEKSDDENTVSGALIIHRISQHHVAKGLAVMAEKFPHHFAQVIKDDTDAPCADIFLQCVLFGEEKYA